MRWSEAFGEWVNGFMGEWVNGFMGLWGRTQHAHAARLFPSTHSRERSEQTSRASASKHPIHPFTHSPIHPLTILLLRVIFMLSALVLLPHCAGSKPARPAFGPPAPTVAAGLDSAVVARSDALAESLFVSWERQEAAQLQRQTGQQQQEISDALWQALGNAADSSMTATADTVQAIGKFNQGAQQLLALQQLQQTGGDPVQLRARSQAHLDSARIYFEAAIRLNPFDANTRLWLARVYQLLAERFLADTRLPEAALMLRRLIRMDRGQHGLHGRLGEVYLRMNQWAPAKEQFSQAEFVLRETAEFQVPEGAALNDSTIAAALDSAALFLYVYYQAESDIRLHRADSALANLERALPLARNGEDGATVRRTIDWINWDDGNIRNAEYRDRLIELADAQQYAEAAAGFARLKDGLKNPRAAREIDWRLALLEYSHLGREAQALERLSAVVRYYLNDSLQTATAAVDTMSETYFNSFGTMCHNQGVQALKDKKLRRALAYFTQSTEVPWPQQAKSYLEIARLSVNNPAKAVDAAGKALATPEQLDGREQQDALRVMVGGLKRLGRFDEAKEYYRRYRQQVQEKESQSE